jgi:hypothetical protein
MAHHSSAFPAQFPSQEIALGNGKRLSSLKV